MRLLTFMSFIFVKPTWKSLVKGRADAFVRFIHQEVLMSRKGHIWSLTIEYVTRTPTSSPLTFILLMEMKSSYLI